MQYFEMGKELGLDEEAKAEPVRRSEKYTHDTEGTEMVHATVPKRSVDLKRIPKPFFPDAPCDTSVHDVLTPQPFQDSVDTAPLTTLGAQYPENPKKDVSGARVTVKTSAFMLTFS